MTYTNDDHHGSAYIDALLDDRRVRAALEGASS